MRKCGFITVLPFSKYASPIFAQRISNGKLRLLVDLMKVKNLFADDYTNNHHPVSLLSDVAQQLARNSVLQAGLVPSTSMFANGGLTVCGNASSASSFSGRTFAYKRFAEGLTMFVFVFSRFMRDYLDPVVKADQCAQYMVVIGIAANNATDPTRNFRAVFKNLGKTGLKLTKEKYHFLVRQNDFLGRTLSPDGNWPQARQIQNFLDKLSFPNSRKALKRYLGCVNNY